MLTAEARGVYLIAATPFREDGALDPTGLDRLLDWYLGHGIDGLTILGQLGEAPKLTAAETLEVMARALRRVDGRVPVVVGVSSPGHASLAELAQAAMAQGAAGVMVAPPGTLRGDDAVLGYCREVERRLAGIPWVLQDFPLAGGPPMSAALVRAIAVGGNFGAFKADVGKAACVQDLGAFHRFGGEGKTHFRLGGAQGH